MKKIYQTALLALACSTAMAQAFFTPTSYRGAMAPAPTPMWTGTWVNWDPQNTVYPTATQTITSNITTNTTWTTGQTYLLQGQIYVTSGAVLTIQPGVVVLGSKSVPGSGLFITTGSKLNAVGTASQPIVFTSDQPAGSRALGDWGGVILMGLASNNNPGGTNYIEGIAPSPLTLYGGGATPNDNDNSGNLQYIRIEFAGYVYAPNKEINGLTFGAVGRGTTIDYIQVSFANDDAFEWFGGTVNCKHLVAYRSLDDDWDTDNGYSGYVQFCLGVRDPNISDNPSISTSEGFESDNDPTATTNTPLTSAIFSNVTDIGPLRGVITATYASGFRRGARIRRNSNLKVFNCLMMDHPRGVMIDGTPCENNAVSGALKYMYNINAGNQTGKVTECVISPTIASTFTCCMPAWYAVTSTNDSLTSTSGILINPYQYLTPDYRPAVGSPALAGASFTNVSFAPAGVLAVKDLTSSNTQMALYPNPASQGATLYFRSDETYNVSVGIYNVNGQLVSEAITSAEIQKGLTELALYTGNLSNGVYFVTVTSQNNRQTIKLVVNN